MEEYNRICTYKGKFLDDMTRQELIEAIINLGRIIEIMQKDHDQEIKILFGDNTNKYIGSIEAGRLRATDAAPAD